MNKPVLLINACVRKESRTLKLAEQLLKKLNQPAEEVLLEKTVFPRVDEAFLALRDRLIAEGQFNHPMFSLARQFAEADTVVIAAPYWDLSFPAALKQYIEQINVTGITFRYTEDGRPVGLCRARRLFVVTTAGGNFVPEEFGFGYIQALARSFYGIPDVRLISAAGLDLYGADVGAALKPAENAIAELVLNP